MNSILTLSTDLTVVQFRSMTLYTTLYTLYTAQTKSQHHKKCIGDQISQWHNVSNVHRWRNTRVKWQVTRHESHVTSLTTRDKSLTLWDTSLTTRDKSLKSWESLNSRRQKVSRHETRVSRHESRVSLYETLSILPNFCLTVSRASVRAGFPALVSCWHIIIFFIFLCQLINLIWFDFSCSAYCVLIMWSHGRQLHETVRRLIWFRATDSLQALASVSSLRWQVTVSQSLLATAVWTV